MPDPVAHAINHLLDHIQKLDEQVEALKQALLAHGVALKDAPMPELEHCQLGQSEDDLVG